MRPKTIKALTVACLAIAIAAAAWALKSGQRAGTIQGPGAMVAAADGTLWLAVDQQIWIFAADGHRLAHVPVTAVGLPSAPALLVQHPGGFIVAAVRNDATLYVIDPASTQVVRRIVPQWPSDLLRHGSRAINLAIDPAGQIAIATGGGHTVALFSPDGQFLARTEAGSYQFTNGLWWTPEGLWTTDTNRFDLKLRDGRTLGLLRTVHMKSAGAARFLGGATPHPSASAGQATAPLATMIRLANGMVKGQLVDVFADGVEAEYPAPGTLEPRELVWLNGELLATDGASMSVQRWSSDRRRLEAFGDAPSLAELKQRQADKAGLRWRYYALLGVAGVLLVAGLGLTQLAKRPEATDAPAFVDTAPESDSWSRRKQRVHHVFQLTWPMFIAGGVLVGLTQLIGRFAGQSPPAYRPALAAAAMVGIVLLTVWFVLLTKRRLRRFAEQPAFEELFNSQAKRLRRHSKALRRSLLEGEHVVDSLLVMSLSGRWLVQTNQRWLIFTLGLGEQVLQAAHAAGNVVAASTTRGQVQRRRRQLTVGHGWIELAFRDGTVLAGGVTAPTVAQRMVESALQQPRTPPASTAPTVPPPPIRRGPLPVVASAIVPGLGQWIQRRNGPALLLFVCWSAFTLFLSVPLLQTALAPRAAVHSWQVVQVVLLQVMFGVVAAADAYRMGAEVHR